MDYGVHLPLIGFSERPPSLRHLMQYTETAEELGFAALSVNDHLLFSRPWLDGPTALSAVLAATRRMALMTTVALPVVRGPVTLAKSMAAIDLLSGGRLIVGVGPGSSARDYAAVGIPFEERFKRLDEAVETLRALWRRNGPPFSGESYSTQGIDLEPRPSRQGPPIWIGSWGSEAGLRRTARLGDGWLASAYNTTPKVFADARTRLEKHLETASKDPDHFPNAIATMFLYITEDHSDADRVCQNILAPTLNRPALELRERLLIGPPEECARKLAAYQSAGAQRIFLWPIKDEISQLQTFYEQVLPLTPPESEPFQGRSVADKRGRKPERADKAHSAVLTSVGPKGRSVLYNRCVAVYLLLGDDEERKARGVEKLRKGRSVEGFDAAATGPDTVVSACNSFSLFGEGPFVVLRNLDAWNAAQKAVIVDYLQDSSPESDLVLIGKKLGARERLLAAVKKSGEVHTFEQPTGKALVKWLVGHAKKRGLALPEDVAEDLTARCSEDKMRLLQETEKLALYVGDDTATHDDVATLCPPDVQSNIFAFVDALAAGERDRALRLLEDLISTGEPPLRLTFMIRRQFQLVARARALLDRGTPQREIASILKVPPFVARKLDEQGRKLDDEDLDFALAAVRDLESGLKGGSNLPDEFQVELAVLKLSRAQQ